MKRKIIKGTRNGRQYVIVPLCKMPEGLDEGVMKGVRSIIISWSIK